MVCLCRTFYLDTVCLVRRNGGESALTVHHRYVSIILLVVSNFGWFYPGFSPGVCSIYYLVAPALKGKFLDDLHVRYTLTLTAVIQIIISQIIIGYRTWVVSRKSRRVGLFLLVFGLVVVCLESYANLRSRIPVQISGKQAYTPSWRLTAV